MKDMITKVLGLLTTAKVVIDIAIPILEKWVNADLNKDGRIG